MRLLALGLLASGLLSGLAACDAAGANASDGTAHLTLRLTDAPFPFDLADSANVTITRVELLRADTTDDETRVVLYDGAPFAVNLLDLRDGVDTTLASLAIPAGDYRQLRFFVDGDARVVFNDGRVFPLRLPSAQQSGIKVTLPDGDLGTGGDSLDVLVDFDVSRSFVVRGNPTSANFQGFSFRPVLRVDSLRVNGSPIPVDSTDA